MFETTSLSQFAVRVTLPMTWPVLGTLETEWSETDPWKCIIPGGKGQPLQRFRAPPKCCSTTSLQQPLVDHIQVKLRPRDGQHTSVKTQHMRQRQAIAHLNANPLMPEDFLEDFGEPPYALLEAIALQWQPGHETTVSPLTAMNGARVACGKLEINIQLEVGDPLETLWAVM